MISIDVEAARKTIAPIVVETPVLGAPELSGRTGGHVWLKLENLQISGSFKLRGAANKLLSLSGEERERGVVTCSSGNHGRAVAYVADYLDVHAVVCVPEWVDATKLEAIRRYRAEAVVYGRTYDESERRSYELEKERGLVYVHPFDDPLIIAGQGTIGLELLEQLPLLDTVIVPLSGGGLISGITLALKRTDPEYRVVGVSAASARVMYESLDAGKPIAFPEEETIANALSGGIGLDNRYTFELVRDLVDEYVLVSEDEIREAMAFAATEYKLVVEGGGAVGIAALLAGKSSIVGENVAVVVSGGNIEAEVLAQIIGEWSGG
jgi:threonine dehydratase